MTDDSLDRTPTPDEAPDDAATEPAPQYGVGPFSIREVALGGVWLVTFVVSFFSVNLLDGPEGGALLGGANVWVSGLSWILTIALPTVAVFLLALRRLSPQGIRRVGSLGIDQFASVAFSVAALVWIGWLWDTIAIAMEFGFWVRSWVLWVEVVFMLLGVVLTVFAPLLPVLGEDFRDRPETVAHPNARPIRAISPRPERPRPAAATTAAAPGYAATAYEPTGPGDAGPYDAGYPSSADARRYEPSDDTATSATDVFAPLRDDPTDETVVSAQPAAQAFWALVPEERNVVDEYGSPLFRIGPTAWALVIEDRGEVFIVRHEDGRIGYLHDVTGVTRG